MKRFVTWGLLVLVAFPSMAVAEDLFSLGLRSAAATMSPVPAEKRALALGAASALLGHYLKGQGDSRLAQFNFGKETWVEMLSLIHI